MAASSYTDRSNSQFQHLEPGLLARCRAWAQVSALLVCSIASCVLVGWATGITVLKGLVPALVPMNPTTAVAFVLAGTALFLSNRAANANTRSWVALVCACAVMIIGATRVLAFLSPVDLHLDEFLFRQHLAGNRIAPNTALNLTLDGFALVLLSLGAMLHLAQRLVFLAATIAFIAILGYLYHVPLIGLPGQVPMALNTAIAFLIVEFGILFGRADEGPMSVLMSRRSGGRAARRLLPVVILFPIVLGWLRMKGEHAQIFPAEFGVALMVTLSVVGPTLVAFWSARRLNAADDKLERIMRTDSLTGLLTRGALMDILGQRAAEAIRYRSSLSLAMIDIDHFKQVNDTHGHPAGDEVLKAVGKRLLGALRDTDVAGRYGGEEFMVVLPQTPLEGAILLSERVRALVSAEPIDISTGVPVLVSCSIGVAEITTEGTPEPSTIVKSADEALYEAKRSGRNCVCASANSNRPTVGPRV